MTHTLTGLPAGDKPAQYALLRKQADALLDGERDFIANCANIGALLYFSLDQLNWAGVYLMKQNELVLGPFQGKPACVRIPLGTGVCGTAAVRRRTLIVPNVHEFDGHIACDSASNSEIVVHRHHKLFRKIFHLKCISGYERIVGAMSKADNYRFL